MNYIPKFEYEHPVDGTTTITLALPPEQDPFNEKTRAQQVITKSPTGKLQTQHNYFEKTYQLKLVFLTITEIDALRKMFDDFAGKGGSFKYFPSEDEVEFETVTLSRRQFDPKRVWRNGADFIYDLDMQLRVNV